MFSVHCLDNDEDTNVKLTELKNSNGCFKKELLLHVL